MDLQGLSLDSGSCDLHLTTESGGIQFWWIVGEAVVAIGHHPENSPAAYIDTMKPAAAVAEWASLCSECWDLQSFSPKLGEMFRAHNNGGLVLCPECERWTALDVQGYCFLCGEQIAPPQEPEYVEVIDASE